MRFLEQEIHEQRDLRIIIQEIEMQLKLEELGKCCCCRNCLKAYCKGLVYHDDSTNLHQRNRDNKMESY